MYEDPVPGTATVYGFSQDTVLYSPFPTATLHWPAEQDRTPVPVLCTVTVPSVSTWNCVAPPWLVYVLPEGVLSVTPSARDLVGVSCVVGFASISMVSLAFAAASASSSVL